LACAAALAAGDPSYRTVKGILKLQLAAADTATEGQVGGAESAARSGRSPRRGLHLTSGPTTTAAGHDARAGAAPAVLRGPDDLFSPDCSPDDQVTTSGRRTAACPAVVPLASTSDVVVDLTRTTSDTGTTSGTEAANGGGATAVAR
jgi:hypothetical protein